jgi:hypothetical protein
MNDAELQSFLSKAEITDVNTQLVSYWGFTAIDLTRTVFLEKFLPDLVYVAQLYAKRASKTVEEYLQEIEVPLEAWVIGQS